MTHLRCKSLRKRKEIAQIQEAFWGFDLWVVETVDFGGIAKMGEWNGLFVMEK